MTEIPQSFYLTAGFLVITNLGVIFTVLTLAARAVWWASKIDSKVDAAHSRLDIIQGSRK